MRRKVKLVVISDTHLGIYGCQAKLLLNYLKSIDPEILVLNGDIIDIWNYNKMSFSKTQMKVIRRILKLIESSSVTYYVTGNHDEALRKYSGIKFNNFQLVDHLILDIDGKKTWIFHGDIFDATTKGWTKVIAKLGGRGYDFLIILNRFINEILQFFGREKISMSKRIKASVKKAVTWINNFETTAAELAIDQKIDVVICGHIHQPQISTYANEKGSVQYLNSGDWLENCTALEYNDHTWRIHHQPEEENIDTTDLLEEDTLFSAQEIAFSQHFFKNLDITQPSSTILSA
jgi:UDP-2,3-diacylglucosamine pyrophosphatase LpxH